MKWLNRGHEFDEIGANFVWQGNGKKIFIYGAGEYGDDLYQRLKFIDCIEGYIDNDKIKQKEGFNHKKVISIFDFLSIDVGKYIVIVAAGINNSLIFLKQLSMKGYQEGTDLFEYNRFINFYISIYCAYAWDKIYLNDMSFICTTFCNLNCKLCMAFTPYNKNKTHYDMNSLKEDLDIFFNRIDYINLLHISGGEPFLFPELEKLLEYIYEEYSDKINVLSTTTNGTVIPDDRLCKVLAKYKVKLILDDYRENVLAARQNYIKIREKLLEFNVWVDDNRVEEWVNLLPEHLESNNYTDKELENKYIACANPFHTIRKGKLYLCCYLDYATEAGFIESREEDSFDLRKMNGNNRKELVEFIMGYSKKGYGSMCIKCQGSIAINSSRCAVAEQTRGV